MTARAPAASTVRFALLVAAVLATSAFMFLSIGLHLPGRIERLGARMNTCNARLEAEPDYNNEAADRTARLATLARWRACARPSFVEHLATIGAGIGALGAVAAAGYLVHPVWIVRRRRLRRLSAAGAPGLVHRLDELSAQMGLARPPGWLLAAHQRSAGGQAFGLPRRRLVQVDAGLAVRAATDPPAFRAVVLHELAHIRNRDVDKTYLTIAVWRAFLLVAVLPYLVLTLHPALLTDPTGWSWRTTGPVDVPALTAYRLASLVVLTGLVYLTRNAVLRVREVHADAVAAARGGDALAGVLGALPRPTRWWSRWGTHPDPADRIAAVRDPRRLLAGGRWELAAVGLAAGTCAANFKLTLGLFIGFDPVLGVAAGGVLLGAAMAAMLAIVAWRNAAAEPAGPVRARAWAAGPAVLSAGFVAGSFLSLDTLSGLESAYPRQPFGSWLAAAALLLAAAVMLGGWASSAARGVLAAEPVRRWGMPAVVAAAALAGAIGFAVWLPYSLVPYGFALAPGEAPAAGGDIGWYAAVAEVSGGALGPAYRVALNPLTLPALTLLWLVPLLAVRRVRLRRAVLPAAVAGAAVAAFAAALPFAARALLPAEVRRDPSQGAPGTAFYLVLDSVMTSAGALAVAAAVVAVLLRRGPLRPVLALFAGTLTALFSTLAMFALDVPLSCATNVWEMDPAPRTCLRMPGPDLVSWVAHWIAARGLIVAIPFALLAAAAAALVAARRGRVGEKPAPVRYGLVPIGLAVLAVGWLAWAIAPEFVDAWLYSLVL